MPSVETPDEDMRRIRHDMKGPLVNISGFCSEILAATRQLEKLVQENGAHMPVEFRRQVEAILDSDIYPCMGFVDQSIAQLDERIDKFTSKPNRE